MVVTLVTSVHVRCVTSPCDWLLCENKLLGVLFVTYNAGMPKVNSSMLKKKIHHSMGKTEETAPAVHRLSAGEVGSCFAIDSGGTRHSWESIAVRKHSAFRVLASDGLAFFRVSSSHEICNLPLFPF